MNTLNALPIQQLSEGLDLLKGVSVLDLTTSVAGPYGTQLLADLGAEVVKVERRGTGDDTRAWGPPFLDGESLWFLSVNRNKSSITIDITRPEGKRVLYDLVKVSDVVVLNTSAAVQAKLGVDYTTLSEINPSLIHVSITGFGLQGPRAELPCYDLIAEGYAGIMDLTGEPTGGPQKVGTPASDLLAGQDAAMATLAALYERSRTGKGKQIDVSMVASSARFMSPRIVPYLGSDDLPRRSGGRDSVIAIYQVFDTADFPMTLGLGNDAIWKRFWDAVGCPEFGAEAGLSTNAQRRNARERIVARIADILVTRTRAEWLSLFAERRIPAGPINTIEQLVADPVLRNDGMFFAIDGPAGRIPQVGLGIRFDGHSETARKAPPKLGQHSENILRERLAMSSICISGLMDSEIV